MVYAFLIYLDNLFVAVMTVVETTCEGQLRGVSNGHLTITGALAECLVRNFEFVTPSLLEQ